MRKVKQSVKQNGFMGHSESRGRPKNEIKNGAGDGIRTRDLLLGKETCYHCTTPARNAKYNKF
jgi:hypothetical protein